MLCPSISKALTFQNFEEIKRALNTQAWSARPLQKRVKIAILDKGFYGYQNELGHSLPQDAQYIQGPIEPPKDLVITHGLAMAQIVTAIMESPELYLYNVYGYSNLKFAIEDLTKKGIELVLYSEVWEFGSNHDGQGFINALVDKALDKGVMWINAAGNFAQTHYTNKIQTIDQNWVLLPDQNRSLQLNCQPQGKSTCQVKIVLSWNDFRNSPDSGTNKDLDLALTDDLLNILQTSGLKQTTDPNENRPGYSLYPRETIVADIKPGTYFIRVKNKSLNFTASDELYITADGDGVSIPSHSRGHSIFNPADNPRVITVGALDSERSSYNYKLSKPNLLTMSSIKTSEGEFRGSSNAAALVAASLGLVKSRIPGKNYTQIISESKLPGWYANLRGLSVNWLGFTSPTGPCFNAVKLPQLPQQITDILNVGGLLVQTTFGYRIMTPYDPILLTSRLQRYQYNDVILTTPEGFRILARNTPGTPQGWVEVFQTPQELGLCHAPDQTIGEIFRLKN